MQPQNDDEAWRAIIENYGDRADIDEPPVPPPPTPPSSTAPFGGRFGDLVGAAPLEDDEDPFVAAEEEGYEPPPPPPLPRITPDRGLAWLGVFGSPVLLLASLLLSISIPSWFGYLLIVGFVGGFVYLVYTMPREPREPWDDGAQV